MAVADAFAKRSLCVRSQVAAVIVTPDNRVVSIGYNGPPAKMNLKKDCRSWCPHGKETELGTGTDYNLSCTIHAEINAITRADWVAMQGGTLYATRTPCHDCVKVIGGSGLANVVFRVLDIDAAYYPNDIINFLVNCDMSVTVHRPGGSAEFVASVEKYPV
jgi:deoxycytidylate deaminase